MARFLVVDDDDDALFLVNAQLRSLGQQVATTDDVEVARGWLSEGSFDGLIIDVSMPEIDGPSFIAEIRRSGTEPDHVFLMSALPPSEVEQTAKDLGVTPLCKPFTSATLRKVLEPALD